MTLKNEKTLNLISKSSLFITISGLISKILAAIYRIPYQNLVGDRGFYAYQQIYPLLAIISALSLTALPNVVASLCQKNKKEDIQALFVFQIIMTTLLSLSLVIFNKEIAVFLGSRQFAPSIIITAVVLLTVPFISIARGFAQAELDMTPTAVSQVIEQFIRIVIIILAAVCYLIFDWTVYTTANVAACGNLIASLSVLFYFSKKNLKIDLIKSLIKNVNITYLTDIGLSSFVFIFFSVYLLLFQFIDALFVKKTLVESGKIEIVAEITKGIYDRGQPLIQFGLIFSTAFFTTFLPKLTKDYYIEKENYMTESQSFFEFIYYFNTTLSLGFMCILGSMNRFLFEDNNGWLALEIYLGTIALSSFIQFFHQKMFIEENQNKSFIYLSFGLLLKIMLTPILTYYFSVIGSSLSTVLPLVMILILYIRETTISLTVCKNRKFIFSLIVMSLTVLVSQYYLPSRTRLDNLISILVSTFSGLVVFLTISKRLKVFEDKLWSYLPFINEK